MATTVLPVIDLSCTVNPQSRLDVARKLVDALQTVGFLYVDHAPGFNEDEVKRWCLWFFDLPQETKFKLCRKLWNPESKNVYRGCFPLQKGETSYKEGFEIGNDNSTNKLNHPIFGDQNVWPEADGVAEFKEFMLFFFDNMMKVSIEICHLLCLGLGLKEDWLDSTFLPDSLSTLRLLHYPVRTEPPPAVAFEDDVTVCCADHSDSGFLTLLTPFDYYGLQIKLDSGEWLDVPRRKNALVMNIGDMLSKITKGNLKATRHRVLDPAQERFAVPFFLEPSYDADVGYILPCFDMEGQQQNSGKEKSTVKYGSWLLEKMLEFAEFRYMINAFNQEK